jgi:pilus assembly protein CpaC
MKLPLLVDAVRKSLRAVSTILVPKVNKGQCRRGNSSAGKAMLVAVFVAAQFPIVGVAQAERVNIDSRALKLVSRVTVIKNKSKNIRLDVSFADAAVGSTDIAEIVAVSDRQLYILGKKNGATNVLLYNEAKQLIGVVDVEVKMDTGRLGARIRDASGGDDIQVDDVDGKLVLSGNGGDAQTIERAMSIAKGLGSEPVNALKLKSNQQVMLKVRFVEASRSAARAIGVRWQGVLNNRMAGAVGTRSGTSNLAAAGLFPGYSTRAGGPTVPGGASSGVVLDVVSNTLSGGSPVATVIAQLINSRAGSLDVVLSALEEHGVVRRLAEPNLVALSGETAEFLAGGEYPVPIVAGGGVGTVQQVTITYKEFGVRLRFTPTVLARSVISLKLEPEVSDLDYAIGVSVGGVTVPGLTVRRARTTVELRDGQTFAIAGLIQARSDRQNDQIPWLGTVPVLGALFRSADFLAQETELVALVTPHLVKPVPPGAKDPPLKTPLDSSIAANDVDFFLGGKAEISKLPPTYAAANGTEQPVYGARAPGAPEAEAPPFANPFRQLLDFLNPPRADALER